MRPLGLPVPTFSPSPASSPIAPLVCEKCGGAARVMRRAPDAFKRDGKTEIRTYECAACGHQMTLSVET